MLCCLLSRSVVSDSLRPHGQPPLSLGILQARTLEWVAMPSCRGSSRPRDPTQVFLIAGGFFTSRVTREAQEYWCGQLIPALELPDPGVEPGCPALQVDSLPTELPGKPTGRRNIRIPIRRVSCVLHFRVNYIE